VTIKARTPLAAIKATWATSAANKSEIFNCNWNGKMNWLAAIIDKPLKKWHKAKGGTIVKISTKAVKGELG
jgi:hypothetical protein